MSVAMTMEAVRQMTRGLSLTPQELAVYAAMQGMDKKSLTNFPPNQAELLEAQRTLIRKMQRRKGDDPGEAS